MQLDSLSCNPIRLLCVDDHVVLFHGLDSYFRISHHVQCIGHLRCADQLLTECARLRPDVVLLDVEMPGRDAFEMVDRLSHAQPAVRCIFLTAHVRDGFLTAAYRSAASGYFSKGDDLDLISAGIEEVARSDEPTFVMGPKVRQGCVAFKPRCNIRRSARRSCVLHLPSTKLQTLSSRELEVLRLIGKGMTRSAIANELCRSVKTIDGHQEHIMKKIGVHSRGELICWAVHEGLVEA